MPARERPERGDAVVALPAEEGAAVAEGLGGDPGEDLVGVVALGGGPGAACGVGCG